MTYTTLSAIAQHLERDLTIAQEAEAYNLLAVADAFIDSYTGTVWNTSAAVTAERHTSPGPYLYLKRAPVTTVSTVTVREPYVGSTAQTLSAGSGYELLDATRGILRLGGSYQGYEVRVTYTPAVPLDSRIALAATRLVAHWMQPTLTGVLGDIKSYAVGQELEVTYRDPESGTTRGIPADILTLLDSARARKVVFA